MVWDITGKHGYNFVFITFLTNAMASEAGYQTRVHGLQRKVLFREEDGDNDFCFAGE